MQHDRAVTDLESFLARRGEPLLRTAVLLTGSKEAGEDLLQAGLERLLRHWSRIDGDPEGYLRRTLYNLAADGWRQQRAWRGRLRLRQSGTATSAADGTAAIDTRDALIRLQFTRTAFPAGTAVQPDGVASMNVAGKPGSPWQVGYLEHLKYRGSSRISAFTASGQRVFDLGVTLRGGSLSGTTVDYGNKTWWQAGISGLPVGPASGPGVSCGPQIQMRVGTGWPDFIRTQLKCGEFTVAGRQEVDGVNAIKIISKQGTDTFWVSPRSYLPVRLITSLGGVRQQSDFQWLAPIPARLAQLKVTALAGFRLVQPPWQKAKAG